LVDAFGEPLVDLGGDEIQDQTYIVPVHEDDTTDLDPNELGFAIIQCTRSQTSETVHLECRKSKAVEEPLAAGFNGKLKKRCQISFTPCGTSDQNVFADRDSLKAMAEIIDGQDYVTFILSCDANVKNR
jgi:hypothetical protein